MKEVFGNLWTYPGATFRGITTNGSLRPDGTGVMGAGVAGQARKRFPGIEVALWQYLARGSNSVVFPTEYPSLFYFPVKHQWREHASLPLIVRSSVQLAEIIECQSKISGQRDSYLLPRPGCGVGGLRWEDVKPTIEEILPDEVWVIERMKERDHI